MTVAQRRLPSGDPEAASELARLAYDDAAARMGFASRPLSRTTVPTSRLLAGGIVVYLLWLAGRHGMPLRPFALVWPLVIAWFPEHVAAAVASFGPNGRPAFATRLLLSVAWVALLALWVLAVAFHRSAR